MAGLYFHIPFCRKACTYCDFHFSTSLKTHDAVVNAMQQELEKRAGELHGEAIHTIYFGGGTPSLLSPATIGDLIARARTFFTVDRDAEVTLEANPDDISAAALSEWRSIGVTRLSIGVQSFRDDRLRFMGRAHDAAQSHRALELIAAAGLTSWTMDLIYGLPQMTTVEWDEQIASALSHAPPHVSAYCLTVEPRTTLDHRVRAGDVTMPDDGDQAEQFARLSERLQTAGLVHYEISNFGREGHFSRHNVNYWNGSRYLGIGPGAHSFDGHVRRWNVANNPRYAKAVPEGTAYWTQESLTPAQRTNERLMTGLRTMWGVELAMLEIDVTDRNGLLLDHYVARGDMRQEQGRLVLTAQGRAFADRIASDLFVTDDAR